MPKVWVKIRCKLFLLKLSPKFGPKFYSKVWLNNFVRKDVPTLTWLSEDLYLDKCKTIVKLVQIGCSPVEWPGGWVVGFGKYGSVQAKAQADQKGSGQVWVMLRLSLRFELARVQCS